MTAATIATLAQQMEMGEAISLGRRFIIIYDDIATIVGQKAAALLSVVRYWCYHAQKKGFKHFYREGSYWYDGASLSKWVEDYGNLVGAEGTVRRSIRDLLERGILVRKKFGGHSAYSYRIDYHKYMEAIAPMYPGQIAMPEPEPEEDFDDDGWNDDEPPPFTEYDEPADGGDSFFAEKRSPRSESDCPARDDGGDHGDRADEFGGDHNDHGDGVGCDRFDHPLYIGDKEDLDKEEKNNKEDEDEFDSEDFDFEEEEEDLDAPWAWSSFGYPVIENLTVGQANLLERAGHRLLSENEPDEDRRTERNDAWMQSPHGKTLNPRFQDWLLDNHEWMSGKATAAYNYIKKNSFRAFQEYLDFLKYQLDVLPKYEIMREVKQQAILKREKEEEAKKKLLTVGSTVRYADRSGDLGSIIEHLGTSLGIDLDMSMFGDDD